jgi:hypothetical protein
MPKHEAATWYEDEDAETRALTVSSQGRHSQGAQFTWPKQPVNCDAKTASAAM